ncbi:Peroxidase 17 [Striga hermonthica]|uniref:peroxidase n=1 Tax=Striga hermonthica TaxID=68872 RepID=A0A9N7NR88_STRHE|nr:Peroxidase 17 [Striga hermonthica]
MGMAPLFPFLLLLLLPAAVSASPPVALRPGFYSETCPEAEAIARGVLRQAMAREIRSAASVMRLQFHDCLVNVITNFPRADASSLMALFAKFNLSTKDLVALSGSHSIGKARCFSVVFRLYNQSGSGQPDPAIDPQFREELDELCPQGGDEEVTGNLDGTPERFDNRYFSDLVEGRGFLNSDQTLFTSRETREYVRMFSRDQGEFFRAFVDGMIKLGDLQSGRPGEIRRDCRVVNDGPLLLTQAKR